MSFIYNIGIRGYGLAIRLAALFQAKARQWVAGRKAWRQQMAGLSSTNAPRIWIHAASLGEMEQGLPIIKALRRDKPDHQIIISFFSPSGYLNFKHRDLADAVVYLPLDLPKNAADFLELLQPDLALFIKYEIWPNFIKALKNKGIPCILAPAVFRNDQIYFKPYGGFFRSTLRQFETILVQDQNSKQLLNRIGIKTEICGDSRFDQAQAIKESPYQVLGMEDWVDKKLCLVAGSSWPQEERLLQKLLIQNQDLKIILAPHEVSDRNIQRLVKEFERFGVDRFSQSKWSKSKQVLIIDNIGQLKMLYRYGNLAFVGGGFGVSVHSTVEPAVYEIPIAFGPKYEKFVETKEMLQKELAFEIKEIEDLQNFVARFSSEEKRANFKPRMQAYLQEKLGAVEKISVSIQSFLNG